MAEATCVLEQALKRIGEDELTMPGWLVGRLAMTYRSRHRYADEVRLLEQYAASYTSEVAATHFSARLSKAQALAEKTRRHPNGATASVARSISRI